jgi:cytochrome oxidase Cu insertion factor (SCO1/SenC/PrrC family)
MKTTVVAVWAVLIPALGAAIHGALGMEPGARPQEAKSRPAEAQPGVKVDEKAPRFTLKDQEGKDRSLDEFLARGKVALVFYRSADW